MLFQPQEHTSSRSRTDELSVRGHHHSNRCHLLGPLLSAGQPRLKATSSSVHAFPECVIQSMCGDLVPVGTVKAQLRFSSI